MVYLKVFLFRCIGPNNGVFYWKYWLNIFVFPFKWHATSLALKGELWKWTYKLHDIRKEYIVCLLGLIIYFYSLELKIGQNLLYYYVIYNYQFLQNNNLLKNFCVRDNLLLIKSFSLRIFTFLLNRTYFLLCLPYQNNL